MTPIYASQPFPHTFEKSLYLAGPTPRDPGVPSWRPRALKLLEAFAYNGVVFVPESQNGTRRRDYLQQMDWELEAMRRSDVLLFWVPATKDAMPAYTTRVEFGLELRSGKMVFGAPRKTYKTRYLRELAKKYNVASHHTLEETIEAAFTKLGRGAKRSGPECLIPLELWWTPHFQQWYAAQTSAGHVLEEVQNVEWVFRVGPQRTFPLFFSLHVAIRVHSENRVKTNEVVIIRPSMVTVCLYCWGNVRENDRFLLVKEYRTSALNEQGFVFELPGGSSLKPDVDPQDLVVEELERETGIQLTRDRFHVIGRRQIAATMIANAALLVAARLESSEMDRIAARHGEVHGNTSETERTYMHVFTRKQILEGNLVDYATLGQISLVGERRTGTFTVRNRNRRL